MAKKCLVVGASGFIGAYVVEAMLDAGCDVVGTGRNPHLAKHYRELGVEYGPFDLNDPASLDTLPADVDFVAYLAGRLPANSTFDLSTEDDAADYIRTNTPETALLLEWTRKNGIGRIISTTSYADVQNSGSATEPVREDCHRNFKMSGGHAAYVISKNASADLLFYYNEQYGKRNCVFRLPPVYGFGSHGSLRVNGAAKKPGIGLFVDKAKVGKPISVFGDADAAVRDTVYVKDVAQAFVLVGMSGKASGLYSTGSGRAVSLRERAKAMVDVFSGDAGVSEVRVDKGRPNGVLPYSFDISRAVRDFGYAPRFVDFRDLMDDWKSEEERGVMLALIDCVAGDSVLSGGGESHRLRVFSGFRCTSHRLASRAA